MQNALLEHSAILLTFIKLPFVFKTFVLSFFKWLLLTGFTVLIKYVYSHNKIMYRQLSRKAKCLHISFNFHLLPYFGCASSDGTGEAACKLKLQDYKTFLQAQIN